MRVMMLVLSDPDGEPYSVEEDRIDEWGKDVDARGVWIDGNRLRPADEAVTVRVRHGAPEVSHGALTPATEQLVGYDILECASVDEAVEIATKHPMARFGRIELRPIWPLA